MYGRASWSPTWREEHSVRVSENRVLGKILGPKWYEVTGGRIKLHDELHNNIIRSIKSKRMMRHAGKYRAWKKWKTRIQFFLETLTTENASEDLDVDGCVILKRICDKQRWRVWTGLIWFRILTDCGLLWTRKRTLGFHKRWGIFRLFERTIIV
jgi:hypothetical protein